MSDDPYLKLREFLDRFPLGYPETDSGVEIKILKRLFTEEQAELVVLLSILPEETEQIAGRTGTDLKKLEKNLEEMAKEGLIFRIRREGKTFYRAAPFMIGLYEYSVKKIDKELAALFKEYYETTYFEEMGASNIPGFKVVPISHDLQEDTVLYPFLNLKEDIKAARKIAVAECVCRKEAILTGEACDRPMENCLSFGVAAEFYIYNGMGREITSEEAIKIVEEADEAGLVHAGANSKHLSNICNCCPCCCISMKGITKKGHNKRKYMNALFEAVIDQDECSGCEDCVERCPVGAIAVEEIAVTDSEKCLGCGLCAGICQTDAISMRLRDDMEEPFDRVIELGAAILKSKMENA